MSDEPPVLLSDLVGAHNLATSIEGILFNAFTRRSNDQTKKEASNDEDNLLKAYDYHQIKSYLQNAAEYNLSYREMKSVIDTVVEKSYKYHLKTGSFLTSVIFRTELLSLIRKKEKSLKEQIRHRSGLSIELALRKIDAYAKANPGMPVSDYILEVLPEIKTLNGYVRVNEKLDFSAFEGSKSSFREHAFDNKEVSVRINVALPKKAPELYKGRADTSEDGPAFYNRVYKDYIGNGLTRPVLSELDPPLVRRIDYLKHQKKDPEALALDLPTAWVAPQTWADRVLAGEEEAPIMADAKTHIRNKKRLDSARERSGKKHR